MLRGVKDGEISEEHAIKRLERSRHWVWTAIDPENKVLLAIAVGPRTLEMAQRVVHHVRRMEQGAETAVQIHFSALGHRTNEIMRVLTALTAVFLPLNFMTGFFGMNFEFLPLIHSDTAMWVMLGVMALTLVTILLVFWRKRYLDRTGR